MQGGGVLVVLVGLDEQRQAAHVLELDEPAPPLETDTDTRKHIPHVTPGHRGCITGSGKQYSHTPRVNLRLADQTVLCSNARHSPPPHSFGREESSA